MRGSHQMPCVADASSSVAPTLQSDSLMLDLSSNGCVKLAQVESNAPSDRSSKQKT